MPHHITKARLYHFDPLKPHFYIVTQGFTEVNIIFLFLSKKKNKKKKKHRFVGTR